MAVRKPSREKRMPPLLIAVTIPCRVWLGGMELAARLSQWPEASFQAVRPSIQRASQPTPARYCSTASTSMVGRAR